jgi:hypothetical protein
MDVRPGSRLVSQVCSTEVIVVSGAADLDLRCGGHAMVHHGQAAVARVPGMVPLPGFEGGTVMGKRYLGTEPIVVEVLVTKGGSGTLTVGGTPMEQKAARALPSSD